MHKRDHFGSDVLPPIPLCDTLCIESHKHVYYTSWENGVVERMNRTLLEKVRAKLVSSSLSEKFRGEALCTVAYLVNRAPSIPLGGKCPESMFIGKPLDLTNLRVFGRLCYVHKKVDKSESRSKKCVFLGCLEDRNVPFEVELVPSTVSQPVNQVGIISNKVEHNYMQYVVDLHILPDLHVLIVVHALPDSHVLLDSNTLSYMIGAMSCVNFLKSKIVRLNARLLAKGFTQKEGICVPVYVHLHEGTFVDPSLPVYLLLYVDNMLIVSPCAESIEYGQKYLCENFDMIDLSKVEKILGMKSVLNLSEFVVKILSKSLNVFLACMPLWPIFYVLVNS